MKVDEQPFKLITKISDINKHQSELASHREKLANRTPPSIPSSHQDAALRYEPSEDLLMAINMALHTYSPLLLTGEPGTGKTQAADFIGKFFGIEVFKFLVKSTSTARDLMYEFDAVGYLHWAQADRQTSATNLHSKAQAVRRGFLQKRPLWQAYKHKQDSVVLIDEIDKAPRDFPNDLLHELDQHSFQHPFNPSKWIKPVSGRPPIIVITSNEERRLPDAFLRRCIFHRIELTEELIKNAVESMAGPDARGFPGLSQEIRDSARQRFWDLWNVPGLNKKPSTAELLTWLSILSVLPAQEVQRLPTCRLKHLPAVNALVKDSEDLKRLP